MHSEPIKYRNQSETSDADAGSVSRAAGDAARSRARLGILWDGAAIALLACTALVVLAVPVFPSECGPIHLYYVDIIRSLLTHSGPYTQHFEIKTLLPPYALEYYSLLVFEMVFSPEMSEKLLVCCYIFAFGLGFKYLVDSVAERHSPWTLAGAPFCMNLLVYMGFMNYCFGVAQVLFLSGLWIRCQGRFSPGRVTVLLAGFVLMLLTHPVPIAIFLLFTGLHFVADLARAAAGGSWLWAPSLRARWRPLALIALMAVIAAIWVGMFVDHAQRGPAEPSSVAQIGWIRSVAGALRLGHVVPFRSPFYRIGLLLLVATAGVALLVSIWRRRGRASSAAIAMIATSAICFTLLCVAPDSINGSAYFPDRFAILWVMFLIAAAAALHPPRSWSLAAGVIALCATSVVLPFQWVTASRIASELRPALEAPPAKAGSVGLLIGAKHSREGDLWFAPFFWGGAHYFRRSGAILANAPWMWQTHIMLRPAHPDRWTGMGPYPAGQSLVNALSAGATAPDLSFVVWEGPPSAVSQAIVAGLAFTPLPPNGRMLGIYARQP